MRQNIMRFAIVLLAAVLLVGGLQPAVAQDGTGTLEFYANGEDFVREGFVSKDGWLITFDAITVSLADITAYQTDPPYDAESGADIDAEQRVMLDDSYVIDLAAGDADADPILVAAREDAPAGHYNALGWRMVNAEENDGYSLVIVGNAVQDEREIAFTIQVETEYAYTCGEYVGDVRKGILDADDYAELEMTFHFDHIFGDGDLPLDDSLNELAPGFDMFAALAEDGMLTVDMAALEAAFAPEDYQMLVDILPTLGHVGEGHCHEASLPAHDDTETEEN